MGYNLIDNPIVMNIASMKIAQCFTNALIVILISFLVNSYSTQQCVVEFDLSLLYFE